MEAGHDLDARWRATLELAWEAYLAGTIPVGAVVADADGRVVARGRNRIFEPAGTGLSGSPTSSSAIRPPGRTTRRHSAKNGSRAMKLRSANPLVMPCLRRSVLEPGQARCSRSDAACHFPVRFENFPVIFEKQVVALEARNLWA